MQPRPHVCLHLPRHPCCPGVPARGHPGAAALSPLPVLARGARCSGGGRQRCLEQGEQFPQLPSPWCAQQLAVSMALPSSQAGTVSFSPGLAPALVPACLLPASLLIVPAGWESSWTAIWLILVSLCLSLLTLWHQHLRFSAQCFALPTLRSPGSGVPTLASVQFDKLAFSVFRIISSSYSGAFPNKYSILQE